MYCIKPEKTAIVTGVSRSCKELIKDYINGFVLDYGFGKLRNSNYMKNNGISTLDILDTNTQIIQNQEKIKNLNIQNVYNQDYSLPENHYDYILLSFVLNVVEKKEDRIFILKNIKNGLTKNGKVYIEVRDCSFVKKIKNIEEYSDGYVVGPKNKKTFQKPYSMTEIEDFVKENGFNIVKKIKTSNSIILVSEKGLF